MASKCISKLAWLQHSSSHHHGIQVHHQTSSIMPSTFPKLPSLNSSPNSLHHGFQVYLQTHTITASKCISKLDWLQPLSWHDHGLQVYRQSCTIMVSKFTWSQSASASPSFVDHSLGLSLWVHSIMVWCTSGARRKTAHHLHTAAPCVASKGYSWQCAVLG
jgi:hypothetical protein